MIPVKKYEEMLEAVSSKWISEVLLLVASAYQEGYIAGADIKIIEKEKVCEEA